ncbi:F-box/FBD/LRR-repeat protein At1g13570-like [Mercurialis annua]|uniref:F-box/FBD/LRR-repeat protein At1g13570-like n=1 Tax=Mercurialis annua TaxID=3986 RepID=UPI0021603BE2|nr:F-box/FBD/LRR-repeat protein At1g13570-like [Mercurialis annua]
MESRFAKKFNNNPKIDIMSNLPSNIIDNILIRLPIHQAVQTCILSRTWRFNWRYLSKLVFDKTFYERSVLSSSVNPNISNLFFNIYKVLLLHHGPILSFTLYVPLSHQNPEIDQLMVYLSEKDIQEIFFEIEGKVSTSRLPPSYMFSCVTLRRLTLSSCSFKVPLAFQGFVKLTSLTFDSVYFVATEFETFIPKCPLLESLSVIRCRNIIDVDIDLPYLKFFHLNSSFKTISVRKTSQHLSTVILDGCYLRRETSEPTKFFACLPLVLEHLRLGSRFLNYLLLGTMPRKLSATLDCLKILELPSIQFRRTAEVSIVLCLIMSSPNLQKLEIGSLATWDEITPLAPELFKVQDLSDNALKKLQVVKMNLSKKKGVRPELEFIKFLLAEAEVLENMFIQPAKGTVAEQGLKILKKVILFQRSSKKVEIVYLDPQDDGKDSNDGSDYSDDSEDY